jgi:hypothetical protein
MSEAKVGFSATVLVEVVGLFVVILDFVNAFGFVPLHVLKPAMRINVSINMLFGIAACYSRESAAAMPITSGATRLSICFALEMPPRKSMRSIANKISKSGWSWGCVSGVDSNGRTIFVADAHRGDGKRFVVRADEKLTAFVELELAIRAVSL